MDCASGRLTNKLWLKITYGSVDMIYVTKFCPQTRRVLEPAKESVFRNIDEVVLLMGHPITRGKRTATYRNQFFSEYKIHTEADNGEKVFLNREA